MVDCPRGIDSSQMESIFDCKYYRSMEDGALEVGQANIDLNSSQEGLSPSKPSGRTDAAVSSNDLVSSIMQRREQDEMETEAQRAKAEEEKQRRIKEILKEWEKNKGELQVVCKKCESVMTLVKTYKESFYRCSNYPECQITADLWYVGTSQKKRIVSQKIHADLIKLYHYDKAKNLVEVSEIFSEGKLFL